MTHEKAYKSLYRRVRNAHIRHCGLSFYFYLMRAIFIALVLSCISVCVMKLLPYSLDKYLYIVPASLIGVAFPCAMLFTWLRRSDLKTTAMLADKHLHLKEKISSALELSKNDDISAGASEWNDAILNDALYAADRLKLTKAFPLTHPGEFRWIWIPVMVLILTIFVIPQWNYLTNGGKQAMAQDLEHKEVQKHLQKLMQRRLVLDKKVKDKKTKIASELSKEIKNLSVEFSKGKIEKRDALAKLSSLEKEWEKRKKQIEGMKPNMSEPLNSGLKPKMTNELAEAMKENDFEKAAKALNKLQKQIKLGNIDPKGLKQLSSELSKMASMMNMDLPMVKALDNAGQMLMSSDLNGALQPLQIAEMSMKDMKDLMEQMKILEASLKDLKDCKFAMAGKFGKCEKCGKCFGKGEGCCNGNCFGNGTCLGNGTKPWKPGFSRKQGNGMGGPGIGRGGKAPFKETSTQMSPDKLKSMFGNAPIQAMLPVDGPAIKGQSNITVNDSAIFEYSQESEEALTKERVPLPIRNQVRSYFETSSGSKSDSASSE